MERSVEALAAVHFIIIGFSHILHSRTWAEFFIWLRERGRAGIFVHGFLSLGFGSLIVSFHNVWSGLQMILTIVGWGYLLKAVLCFLVPATQEKSLGRVSLERAWEMMIPGVIYVALGFLQLYLLFRN